MRNPLLLLSLVAVTTALQAAEIADKLVIAHRGASGYLPEHTLEAKVLAFAQGADYLEQDVVMTRDDELLVFHDLTLERTTDVAQVYPDRARADGSWYVIDFTLEELRRLQVSEAKRVQQGQEMPVFPGRFPINSGSFRVHTLQEELALIEGLRQSTGRTVGIYPELKSPWFHHQHGKDLATATLSVLREHGYVGKDDPVLVQSFDWPELVRVHEQVLPALGMSVRLVQLIAENEWQETFARTAAGEWIGYDYGWMHSEAGVSKLATVVDGVGPGYDMLLNDAAAGEAPVANSFTTWAHAAGLEVHPYTFRSDEGQLPGWVQSFDQLLEFFLFKVGVDGVFTDYPDKAVAVVRSRVDAR